MSEHSDNADSFQLYVLETGSSSLETVFVWCMFSVASQSDSESCSGILGRDSDVLEVPLARSLEPRIVLFCYLSPGMQSKLNLKKLSCSLPSPFKGDFDTYLDTRISTARSSFYLFVLPVIFVSVKTGKVPYTPCSRSQQWWRCDSERHGMISSLVSIQQLTSLL